MAVRMAPGTKCFSLDTFARIGLFNSIVNIATDILFAVVPIPIIFKLQINLRTKYSLVGILCLGFIACSAGIYKASIQVDFFNDPDRNYHYHFLVWAMIELCLGIMAASLPALKPLFSASYNRPRRDSEAVGQEPKLRTNEGHSVTRSIRTKEPQTHSQTACR